MERKSCFHEDPILLHVPQNTAVELMCQSDKAEVSIQRTTNPKHFEPKLMKGEDLLCGSELRGARPDERGIHPYRAHLPGSLQLSGDKLLHRRGGELPRQVVQLPPPYPRGA